MVSRKIHERLGEFMNKIEELQMLLNASTYNLKGIVVSGNSVKLLMDDFNIQTIHEVGQQVGEICGIDEEHLALNVVRPTDLEFKPGEGVTYVKR